MKTGVDKLAEAIEMEEDYPCTGCHMVTACAEQRLCCASWRSFCALSTSVVLVRSGGKRVSIQEGRCHSMKSVDEYFDEKKKRENGKEF